MKLDFTNQINQKTDNELLEIFANANDYNPEFVNLAEQKLQARNINIDALKQNKESAKQVNRKELEQGKAGSPLYILLGFVFAILGGFIGIYTGYIYSRSKTKTAEGDQYYVYNPETRQFGNIMMGVGIASILLIIYKQFLA